MLVAVPLPPCAELLVGWPVQHHRPAPLADHLHVVVDVLLFLVIVHDAVRRMLYRVLLCTKYICQGAQSRCI